MFTFGRTGEGRELGNSLLYLGNFSASIKLVQNIDLKNGVNIKVQIPKLAEEKAGLKTGYELVEPTDTTLQGGGADLGGQP